MKALLLALSLIISASIFAQSSSPEETLVSVIISNFIDTRDNQSYRTVTMEGVVGFGAIISQTWMAENLNYDGIVTNGQSWCPDGNIKNCNRYRYGRLYTWEAARLACPSGWHLPSDVEWQRLMHYFAPGGLVDQINRTKVYERLIEGGNSGFDAQLAGLRNPKRFESFGEWGYYWSNTREYGTNNVWNYNTEGKAENFQRSSRNKDFAFSCRCIKD